MKKYAVAVCLYKFVPTGTGVITFLTIITAESKEIAEGLAMVDAKKKNEEYSIHHSIAVEIDD